jgi:hypothetical protein
MFLGLTYPDLLVRGTDPDPSLFHKGVERTVTMIAKLNFNTKF